LFLPYEEFRLLGKSLNDAELSRAHFVGLQIQVLTGIVAHISDKSVFPFSHTVQKRLRFKNPAQSEGSGVNYSFLSLSLL
jgi:hypothetical protein